MFKTIVWATDGSDAADRSLPYVKALASESHASLVVVHAVETFVTSYSAGQPILGDVEAMKSKIEHQIADLRADGITADSTILQVHGVRPAHLIADVARDVSADLIVVGTRGHTPVGGMVLGSVTQRLLHLAPCPVLVVPVTGQHDMTKASAAEATAAHA